MKTKSALSHYGSDSESAPYLAAMLDHCKHVTIVFVGGASIVPQLKARAIVGNDLNDLAINFYRVVSGNYGEKAKGDLISLCQHTLSHPSEAERAESCILGERSGRMLRAWGYWAMCWIGRKGKGGTKYLGGMPSVRRTANGGTNASRIRAAAGDLDEWAANFERCEWEVKCFRELMPCVKDHPDNGVYADPPWVGVGRDYLYPFTEKDHRDFRESVDRFAETTVVVRYGDDPLIRELYEGWSITEATSRTQAGSKTGELWITNKN